MLTPLRKIYPNAIINQTLVCSDFRSIIKENKNDELITERERQLRATNIIIHGVGEEIENGKEKDEEFVTAFLGKLGIESKSSSNVRLGNFDPNKTRPIKLKMSSEAEKENIMSRLPAPYSHKLFPLPKLYLAKMSESD